MQEQNKPQKQTCSTAKVNFFSVLNEIYSNRKINQWEASIYLIVTFLQYINTLMRTSSIAWETEKTFFNLVLKVTSVAAIYPQLITTNTVKAIFISAIVAVLAILVISFFYMLHKIKHKLHSGMASLIANALLSILCWILIQPIMSYTFNSFICPAGVACYNWKRIILAVGLLLISIASLILCGLFVFFSSSIVVNENDSLSSYLSAKLFMEIYGCKLSALLFSTFCTSLACHWILVCFYFCSSLIIVIDYMRKVQFYNKQVSIVWGTICLLMLWISINAIICLASKYKYQFILVLLGVPLFPIIIYHYREKRIRSIIANGISKLSTEDEIVIYLNILYNSFLMKEINTTRYILMKGSAMMHMSSCTSDKCVCSSKVELYDISSESYLLNRSFIFNENIYMKHFIKQMYVYALEKIVNSATLHIYYAGFLLKVLCNIHASFMELLCAEKKKPSLANQFDIYKCKQMDVEATIDEGKKSKQVYDQIHNVIHFEDVSNLFNKKIIKVIENSIDLWNNLKSPLPDLNCLRDLGIKIYDDSLQVDNYWKEIIQINPECMKLMSIYGEYLISNKSNLTLGNQLIERSKEINSRKTVDEIVNSPVVLFQSDSSIMHMSGSKETLGRIMKVNNGTTILFGYSKKELVGHSINILIPKLIGKHHDALLQRFYSTGRRKIFNKERRLFAINNKGFCFLMSIIVKQVPSVDEGIEYVGLIRKLDAEADFIITDKKGVIDSFSRNVSLLLAFPPAFLNNGSINIQILAPDLIEVIAHKKKNAIDLFSASGGYQLTFYQPQKFNEVFNIEALNSNLENRVRGKVYTTNPLYKKINKLLNKGENKSEQIASFKLKSSPEYASSDVEKKQVKCEMHNIYIQLSNCNIVTRSS